MRQPYLVWLAVCCIGLAGIVAPARAGNDPDGVRWLERAMLAARTLNYSGTFVYRSGGQSETSRLAHRVENGRDFERLEVIEGRPREVIRSQEEVRCYVPESRLLIIESRSQRKRFPALLSTSLSELAGQYAVRVGVVDRVAGRKSQLIWLDPRDAWRYGHQLWIDAQTGLLLKSVLLNERGEGVEMFTFTQIQIGGPVDRDALKSRFAGQAGSWQVRRVSADEEPDDGQRWHFRAQLPGFRLSSGMNRLKRSDRPDSLHWVFSDGLASISVFIDTLPEHPQLGLSTIGAVNLYQREVGDHLVVIMGEVPPAALKRLGDGIEAGRGDGGGR